MKSYINGREAEPFWIVWNPSGPRPPAVRHYDEREAITEAERLARAHPGQTFIVLATVAARVIDNMQRIDLRDGNHWPDDEVPF